MRLRSLFRRAPHVQASTSVVAPAPPTVNEPQDGDGGSRVSPPGVVVVSQELESNGDNGGLSDSVPPSPGVLTVIERKPSTGKFDTFPLSPPANKINIYSYSQVQSIVAVLV